MIDLEEALVQLVEARVEKSQADRDIAYLKERVRQLEAEVKMAWSDDAAIEEALDFYADEDNYKERRVGYKSAIQLDNGERARKAIHWLSPDGN